MRKVTFQASALLEYMECQKDRKMCAKVNTLLKDIARNPESGIGKPEKLKNNFSGHCSRRIDAKNRIVYRYDDEICEVVQVGGHYEEK